MLPDGSTQVSRTWLLFPPTHAEASKVVERLPGLITVKKPWSMPLEELPSVTG
jgi:hypothetical protein